MKFVAINKAKTKSGTNPPNSRDYKTFHKIADALAPEFEKRIKTSLDEFRDLVDLRDLLTAIATGDEEKIMGTIPWKEFLSNDEDLHDAIIEAVKEAGVASKAQLKAMLERTGRDTETYASFSGSDPRVVRYARKRTAFLITEVTESSKEAVRQAIGDLNEGTDDPRSVAQRIQDAVGLDTRRANAVDRYRDALEQAGVPDDRIDRRAEAYRDRLLAQRADTIARTESINAVNAGQQEGWDQAADRGEIDRKTAKKVWIVTPDDRLCPRCEELAGQAVGIDEQFDTDEGRIDGPGLHPNCRCSMALVLE